jgi:tetratricopeptide (TPR) repeat protein
MFSRLQFGEFIYEQPALGEVEYSFKHALTQEVSYNSILASRRRVLHERIGHAIEELYARQLDDHYSELARHYLRGDDPAKAVEYARLAAEQEINRGSYAESASLIEHALKLVNRLPDEKQRLRVELALRDIESIIVFVVYGGPSPEREHVVRRVCELAEKVDEKEQLLRGLMALCNVYFTREETVEGFELAKRCLRLAEATGNESLLADACYSAGILAASCGRLREAASYFDDAALHVTRTNRTVSVLGFPYGGFAMFRAVPGMLLGRVTEGLKLADDAVRFARNSRNLFFLGLALNVKALTHSLRREPDLARGLAEEAIALSEENGFRQWLNFARVIHGWVLVELPQLDQGINEMEEAITGLRSMGGAPRMQYFISLLAQAYAKTGQSEKGLALVNEALAHVERAGENLDHAEMLRLKGEILLMRDPTHTAEAESCFRAAVEVARAQEAKWWELHVSVSLAQLLRDSRQSDQARTMLIDIYNWFTEGFELPDLKEAKALLDELSS